MSKDGAGSIPVIEGGFVCLVDGQGEYKYVPARHHSAL